MGDRGLTLVELMVALAVIWLVTAAASTAYVKLLRGVKVQGRITEGQVDNLCGFEVLRYDIEMAGYGLPREEPPLLKGSIWYSEAVTSETTPDATAFNDTDDESSRHPRALVFSNNTGQQGSDVLVVKSVAASLKASNKKWSFLYQDGAWRIKAWDDGNFSQSEPTDRIIVLADDGTLMATEAGAWWFNFQDTYYTNASGLPLPTTGSTGIVYGVTSSYDDEATVRMPFNRIDYYLKRPASNFPSKCFEGSFILYRASINHGDGQRNESQPLIDCVMDYQVAFGIDTDGDKAVNSWVSDLNLDAEHIRTQVREVRVFVLYHEGQRDDNFWFSGTLNLGDAQIANDAGFQTLSSAPLTGALSTYTPTGNALHYRWKIAKLAIRPMNLE